MGVAVEVPGLNQFIDEVPDGTIISIEGGVDHPKAVLAYMIIRTALGQGRELIYVGPPGVAGLLEQLPVWGDLSGRLAHRFEGLDLAPLCACLPSKPLVIIDSLSYLVHEKDIAEVRTVLESIRLGARSSGAIIVQLLESELLSKELLALVGFHSDGIIQFIVRDVPDGVTRFMRIEKWMSGSSFERNIYYNYTEGNINVDLRYRVV
ncbi:hypothetical protein [Methanomassiliicoccus luminyensis]|uniref:hypothetical protein n=1 Tax=Methanomassiliicoccus luminyensis TaxID=1080712 RepID=UPI00036BCE6C|nr:hypothetical protein [Methanomassiliicoccus luminyensis]